MRIAIAGASGTGKTTLCNAIAERYSLPVNPVGARSVAKAMGFDNPYDVDRAGKRVEFQKRLFDEKRAWEMDHEAFVTDRSYFDNLTYCALHMAEHLEDDAVAVFTEAMRRYDLVLGLPLNVFQSLGDGVRKTAPAYHQMYEIMLTALLRGAWFDDGLIFDLKFIHETLPDRAACAFRSIDRVLLTRRVQVAR